MNIYQLLEHEEGFESEPYYCSEGFPTIGIGAKIGPKDAPLNMYQLTVTKATAYSMMQGEVDALIRKLTSYEWFNCQCQSVRCVLISMSYQLGVNGLLKFKGMIAALKAGDYATAKIEALDSLWYKQTPSRAIRHAEVLGGKSLDEVYNT